MEKLKKIYRVIRGILFSAIIIVAVLYLALYILLSVPPFQRAVKNVAQEELTKMFGSEVTIGDLSISPFNEVVVHGLKVVDKSGKQCLGVETVGAGISLWKLIRDQRVEITYAEIIGLDAKIYQPAQDAPLNIQFIIDAFKPKEKNKPPTKFDLKLRNVVLRRCAVSFDKEWIPRNEDPLRTDFNHLRLSDLKADIYIPRLSNDDISVDLRRLAFMLSGGLKVETISLKTHITPRSISVNDLVLKLPGTEIRPSDISLNFNGYKEIPEALKTGIHRLVLVENTVTPSDFSWLLPVLNRYQQQFLLSLEASGNLNSLSLERFSIDSEEDDLHLSLRGEGDRLLDRDSLSVAIDELKLKASPMAVREAYTQLPGISAKVRDILSACGTIELTASGKATPARGLADLDCKVETSIGGAMVTGKGRGLAKNRGTFDLEAATDNLDLGRLLNNPRLGVTTADVTFEGSIVGKDVNGEGAVYVSDIFFNGASYGGIVAEVAKDGKDVQAHLTSDNEALAAELTADGHLDGEETWLNVDANVDYMHPARLGFLTKYSEYALTGHATAQLEGNTPDNVQGEVRLTDFNFYAAEQKSVQLDRLVLKSHNNDSIRNIQLRSDWVDADVTGNFRFKELAQEVKCMVAAALPSLVTCEEVEKEFTSDAKLDLTVKANNSLTEFLNLPVRLLVDIPVHGNIDAAANTASLDIDVPYIQQGKNKLVRDTRVGVMLEGDTGVAKLTGATTFPAKKGDMAMNLSLYTHSDNVFADISWDTLGNSFLSGNMSLGAQIAKNEFTGKPDVHLDINPSTLEFGTTKWNVDKASVNYDNGIVDVNGLRLWHENQFVEIDGRASAESTDSLKVKLADIDIGYIFDTLNINYVTFGGTATGDITAWGALSHEPVAFTDNLDVKQLAYNGTVLGDAIIKSHWDNDQKEVTINADITGEDTSHALIDGGIWVTRDSLSFDIDANKVPVGFLAPFMSAFTSDVRGKASGKAKLFGTFSDIDLVGRILADDISIKLDFTNVYYHGTDSVFLEPGKIVIPSFRLYDREGHSAIMTGELTHRYFHDPRFNFRISDVKGMLCYDTNAKMNPDWYGRIYGNGSAVVRGWPGTVSVSVDMTTVGNSTFTFVLNDTQAAEDYRFLTFSDKKKEEAERLRADSIPPALAALQKKVVNPDDRPSTFMMDIRGTITPTTLMTLVMDPVAGDKITARGNGNIQMDYDSESDELAMFGKYELDEGSYNFSLQDLILRDFTIKRGSAISFNGDPFNALLDITATYRVNTNLSDLDKSFSTDRDLARTNVPVDAVLKVDGEMTHPDITFDIELPTLTQDVERKVKSIISTDDMMSRQIIYLLALNRFYTPEYMGSTSNGGELASVASSTLSSQLSNMLGQLTDKFTVAPSFRSDKGDFSDIEVDVALSSRLLNNRLLINGNFGYRDRSTSTTTFIGDFDIEYLLTRNGNLRLKAYNHFNDQNYYLRQALTTQGLGVIWRKDFDNPFSWLHKKKDDKDKKEEKDKKAEGLKDDDGEEKTVVDEKELENDKKELENDSVQGSSDGLLNFRKKKKE